MVRVLQKREDPAGAMCDHSNVKQIITRWREPTSTSHNTFVLHTFTPQVAFQTFPVYFNHFILHITATMLCWFLSDDFSETFIVSWQGLIIVRADDFKSSKRMPFRVVDKISCFLVDRLGICRDRRDRRSSKIFVSCVKTSRKQRSFLHTLQVYTHLNVNFIHSC